MLKILFKPSLLLTFFGLLFFSMACNFKERPPDDKDTTATTTELRFTHADGTIEELNFRAPLELDKIGSNPLGFVVKDLNKDGREDLVLLNTAIAEKDQGIRILMRTSVDHTEDPHDFFEDALILKTGRDQRPQYLVVEDMNQDGIQDLVTTHPIKDTISLWAGQLSGNQFSLANTSTEIQVGDFPTFIAAAEFGAPGTLGVAITNRSSDNISLLFDLTKTQKLLLDGNQGVNKNPLQLVTGDWNSDGCPDLAILSGDKEKVNFLKNTPCPSTSNPAQQKTFEAMGNMDVGESPQGMIVGDWDHDGHWDIAVSNRNDDDISLLYGAGDGSFKRWDFRVGKGPGQLAFTDFNGDGVKDFVIGDLIDQDLTILLSNGDASIPGTNSQFSYARGQIASGSILSGNRPAFIKVIDINNDKKLDILLTLPSENKLSILLQR